MGWELPIMRAVRFEVETDHERVPQQPARKPWRTPQVILADAGDTEISSDLIDDGPQSIS